jgi:hypothetical protein
MNESLKITDKLVEAADAAWKSGGLPDDMSAQKWNLVSNHEAVIAWLESLEAALGEAAELLEDEGDRQEGIGNHRSWRSDAMHVDAMRCFIGALLRIKTGRTASQKPKTLGDVRNNLQDALTAARDRYMRGNGARDDE